MTMQVAKNDLTLMMSETLSRGGYVAGAAGDRTPGRSLSQRMRSAVRWFVEMPRRRAVIQELSLLSDHELADIGLHRADIPSVFDPAFSAMRNGDHVRATRA